MPMLEQELAQPIPVEFAKADMSESDNVVLHRPAWASKACLGIGCTDNDSPTGVLSYELADSEDATVGAQPSSGLQFVTTLFTGSAVSWIISFEVPSPFLILRWTVSSGGSGDTWTDATGTAGTNPTITWTR